MNRAPDHPRLHIAHKLTVAGAAVEEDVTVSSWALWVAAKFMGLCDTNAHRYICSGDFSSFIMHSTAIVHFVLNGRSAAIAGYFCLSVVCCLPARLRIVLLGVLSNSIAALLALDPIYPFAGE